MQLLLHDDMMQCQLCGESLVSACQILRIENNGQKSDRSVQNETKTQQIEPIGPAIPQILRQRSDQKPAEPTLWQVSPGHKLPQLPGRQCPARHRQTGIADGNQDFGGFPTKVDFDLATLNPVGMFDDVVERLGQNDFGGAAHCLVQIAQEGLIEQVAQAIPDGETVALKGREQLWRGFLRQDKGLSRFKPHAAGHLAGFDEW